MRTAQEIIKENEKALNHEIFWDYRDSLDEQQLYNIIFKEDGLNETENELYEHNFEYISDIKRDILKEILTEEEQENEDLRQEVADNINVDINIKDLLKNSSIRLRMSLKSNEDMIYLNDLESSDCFKNFKKRFRGIYNKDELDKELLNIMGTEYAEFVFYFEVKGQDILDFKEQIDAGELFLRKGLNFGLFNSWIGAGSILEMKTHKETTINLKNWTYKDKKQAITSILADNTNNYYNVSFEIDKNKYGIDETYGLTSDWWVKW